MLLQALLSNRAVRSTARCRGAGLLLAGLAFLALGLLLDRLLIPLNKNLWTPSYSIFTAGWALLNLASPRP